MAMASVDEAGRPDMLVLPSLIKRDFAHRSGLVTGLCSTTLSSGAAVTAGAAVPINDAVGGNWPVARPAGTTQLRRTHRVEQSQGNPSPELEIRNHVSSRAPWVVGLDRVLHGGGLHG